jgi:dTMP kinase
MFVVFEGIDGSGKTTLSGRVAEKLNAQGISVRQARPKGELKSRLAGEIRTLARDPRNLTMSPHTEMFLFIARDTQTIDTVIRPQLNEADVVIADRYLYSAKVLCQARGIIPKEEVAAAVDVAARGLWPDLVVFCDVDIDTSAIRKRIDKLLHPRAPEDFGRKGLRGLGLREAMRQEYLSLAEQNPDKWFVVDNANRTIEENTALIVDKILEVAGRPPIKRERKSYPPNETFHADIDKADLGAAKAAFYDYMRRLVKSGRHGEAAYHLRSIDSDEAWAFRDELLSKVPDIVVYGLAPLSSARAMEIRWRLIDTAPKRVARSLGAEWADTHPDAWEMRRRLVDVVPQDVAATLGTLDTDEAWEMRDRLVKEEPLLILSSLRGLDSPRAWEMRRAFAKKRARPGLLKGLSYLDTEEAWALREKHRRNLLPWVILSLLGLDTERAWKIRRTYLQTATKLVLRSAAGLDTREAWEMRRAEGRWAKEAVSTIKGIDTEAAWRLREKLSDVWPGTVAKSVGMTLAMSDNGFDFLVDISSRHPDDPDVVHYLVKAVEAREGNPS